MSISSADVIISRIKSATAHSKIAVFRSKRKEMLNAVFADTIESRRILKLKNKNFIGIYYNDGSDLEILHKKLINKSRLAFVE